MFSRNMLLQMAVSALVFFLVFRLLNFMGITFVAVIALGVGVWYLVAKRPDVLERWKSKVAAPRPQRRPEQVVRPEPQPDRPLTHDERQAFNDLMRGYSQDPDGRSRRG